jgi:2-oxoglutarate ferredoxin oxidoreductase subunit gamma
MDRTEIRVSGYGGQGVIMAGYIIGKAAALYDRLEATLNQAFGPEARGSACSAQVIIDENKVLYPYIRKPNIVVAMSQEAYSKFEPELASNGILLIDEDLVKPKAPRAGIQIYAIPSTRLAEELGRKIVLNIVMLGFFSSICDNIVSPDSMRKAVKSSVPAGTEEMNMKAFDAGFNYGENLKKTVKPEKSAKPEKLTKPTAKEKAKGGPKKKTVAKS